MSEKGPNVDEGSTIASSARSALEKEPKVASSQYYDFSYDPLQTAIDEDDLELINAHLDDFSLEEWGRILKDSVAYHDGDPLIPGPEMEFLKNLTEGPTAEQTPEQWEHWVKFYAFLFHHWSIYPEVRSVSRPIDEDEEDKYYHSLRVYVIGCCWGMAGAVLSTFFALRYPSIGLGNTAIQILIASSGRLVAKIPKITMPIWKGKRIVINSGRPWTFKEQMLATLTMSVSNGSPYSQDAIVAQANDVFYNFDQAKGFGYIILLTMSSTFMGFGFAGVFRSFLVYQARMVWYGVLPMITLSRTLSQKDVRVKTNGWILTRNEFFWLFTVLWFGWYWVTNTACNFLQYFNWLCWIKPENVNLNAITGAYSGLGVNPIPSFDPTIFGGFSGLLVPLQFYCSWMAGYIISFFAIVIMWYTNVRWTGYLPINSNTLYDDTGDSYNVSLIMDPKTLKLDHEKYEAYSPPLWSAGNIVNYGSFFAIYTCCIVYAILNLGGILVNSFKAFRKGFTRGQTSLKHFQDTFCRRQARYKEVPELWFFAVLACSIGMAIGCVEGYKFTETPVWSIFLGIGLAAVFLPLSGIIQATTTFGFETNVLMELIMGYAIPGNPNGLMVSKVFATNFFGQTDNWITNQKQAHYAGISPRSLFGCQMISALCTCFVQAGIMSWQVNGGIPNLCNPHNRSLFTCQDIRIYFNASVLWGTIGPKRVFKDIYPTMKYCFLIGACIPIPFYLARKYLPLLAKRKGLRPGSAAYYWVSGLFLRNVNELVITIAGCSWAPSNLSYVLVDFYTCLVFQLWVKPRYPHWWNRYAYLIIASVGNGTGWAGLFDFFATEYKHIVSPNWWGNNVNAKTFDYNYEAVRLQVPEGEYFGPRKHHYS